MLIFEDIAKYRALSENLVTCTWFLIYNYLLAFQSICLRRLRFCVGLVEVAWL